MPAYVREYTLGGIIRSAFEIYFQRFFYLIAAYFVPVFPFIVIQQIGMLEEEPVLTVIGVLLGVVASLLATGVITLLISDVCVGNRPQLGRYFGRVFGTLLWKLGFTSLLQTLALIGGMILLIVPGLVFAIWFLLSPAIVMLERTWGAAALKRSKSLSSGKSWRNAGVILILMAVGGVIGGIIGGIFGAIGPRDELILSILFAAMQQILYPLSSVALVLMYYDLKVRKEGYDIQALAEDLKI